MPRIIYRDFDELADAIGGIAGRFVPTARQEKEWWTQVEPVGRLSTQLLQIGGATTFVGDGTPACVTLALPMNDTRRIRIDGQVLDDNALVFVKEKQPFTLYTPQATRWAGIVIPLDDSSVDADPRGALNLHALHERSDAQVSANPLQIGVLRELVSKLCTERAADAFAEPAAQRAAEEEILLATSHVLQASSKAARPRLGRPALSRERVISRTLQFMEASRGSPLLVGDLCRASQVSERTLRNVFHEYFGVSPMRLLKLRQLREIRAALLAADSMHETVASVAARFGIWDFSLFARNYKALYKESPSVTLRRAPVRQQRDCAANDTFLGYASEIFSSYRTCARETSSAAQAISN
jgi:AraC family transcriptional regulator, ethanolamine operon transcriptional activator